MRDAILARKSTRTFVDQPLDINDIQTIKDVIQTHQDTKGVFGNSFEFTFNINSNKYANGKKIGTYGLLKNVPGFIGGVCQNTKECLVDFGYVFETIILELTNKNYGTCWLGGTFKRHQYRKDLSDNEIIPAISPVGFSADKRSLIDRALRSTAQSNRRKKDEELFFDYHTQEALDESLGIIIRQSLTLVRRGPSASNKQPWRAYVDGNTVHFYLERTKNYGSSVSYDIQMLDMGIALCHYEIGLGYFNKKPIRKIVDVKQIENQEYIISVSF
jgi:hypothetical protein